MTEKARRRLLLRHSQLSQHFRRIELRPFIPDLAGKDLPHGDATNFD
jgi:hypothetical protein